MFVHGAEGNGEVCIVAADAGPVVKSFQGRAVHARVLMAEQDMSMGIVANRLNSAHPVGACPKRFHAISDSRDRWVDHQAVTANEIGHACEVDSFDAKP